MINEAFANRAIQFASYSDLPSIILNGSGAPVRTVMLVPSHSVAGLHSRTQPATRAYPVLVRSCRWVAPLGSRKLGVVRLR